LASKKQKLFRIRRQLLPSRWGFRENLPKIGGVGATMPRGKMIESGEDDAITNGIAMQ